jgi:hypothetical protein
VAEQRGRADPPALGADEVGDPFGASVQVARQCVALLSEAVNGVLAALGVSSAHSRWE